MQGVYHKVSAGLKQYTSQKICDFAKVVVTYFFYTSQWIFFPQGLGRLLLVCALCLVEYSAKYED